MSVSTPPFHPREDIEPYIDWQDVARILARAIIADGGLEDVLARLDAEVVEEANEEQRLDEQGEGEWTTWREFYTAAELLRDLNAKYPMLRGEVEGPRRARKLLEAQLAASRDTRRADPTKAVLVSPRIRGNIIERIVQTHGGRVVGEFLHSNAGWTRHGRFDLRLILEALPLPARYSAAISRQAGELDELPTSECIERMLTIDPTAPIGDGDGDGDTSDAWQGNRSFDFHDGPETTRLVEADVRRPSRFAEPGRSALDASNAEIARAVLQSVPAMWNSCTLVVNARAHAHGFDMRIYGPRREDQYFVHRHDSGLPVLVARRFEIMETRQGEPWRRMLFRVARADHPEWRCEVSYDY